MNDLKFFNIRNKAIAPFVYSRVISLQAFLSSGKRNPPISNEIDEILEEVEAENSKFLVITETQLQKYQQLFKKIEIIEGDNLGDIEMKLLDKEIKRNNEECFKKNIIETSCCQNNCLKDKIDAERAFLRNSSFESLF